jgi:hypothetical protein
MNIRFPKLAALTVAIFTLTTNVHAGVITAPPARYQLFLDSTNPGWSTNYTAVSTLYLGTAKLLKYSTAVQSTLTSTLNMTGKYASFKTWNGNNYQQISETGGVNPPNLAYLGECPGFAKAMTGAGGTGTWIKTSTNALSTIFPSAQVVGNDASYGLAPGAMIVNFDGRTTYTNDPTNHVAIVLSVVVANGKVTGANVVSQNALKDIAGTTTGNKMISKYFLPWTNTSNLTSLALSNYHVITAP